MIPLLTRFSLSLFVDSGLVDLKASTSLPKLPKRLNPLFTLVPTHQLYPHDSFLHAFTHTSLSTFQSRFLSSLSSLIHSLRLSFLSFSGLYGRFFQFSPKFVVCVFLHFTLIDSFPLGSPSWGPGKQGKGERTVQSLYLSSVCKPLPTLASGFSSRLPAKREIVLVFAGNNGLLPSFRYPV